jgi:hypothetical protein
LLLGAATLGWVGLGLVWRTHEPTTVGPKSLREHASMANEHVRIRGTVAGPITPNAATLQHDFGKTTLSSFELVSEGESVVVLFDPDKLHAPQTGAAVVVSGHVRDEKRGPSWKLVADKIE